MKEVAIMKTFSGKISKNAEWNCQDAFADDLEKGRFAIADGVSESSYMSQQFAQLLVDTFARAQLSIDLDVGSHSGGGPSIILTRRQIEPLVYEQFVAEVRRRWRDNVSKFYLQSANAFSLSKWNSGELASHATFAGVQLHLIEGRATVLLVGDCYVFAGNPTSGIACITDSTGSNYTKTIRVGNSDKIDFCDYLVKVTLDVRQPDTRMLITTDYIGRKLSRRIKDAGDAWPSIFKQVEGFRDQSEFQQWVNELRLDRSGDPDDDAAVSYIAFDDYTDNRSVDPAQSSMARPAVSSASLTQAASPMLPDSAGGGEASKSDSGRIDVDNKMRSRPGTASRIRSTWISLERLSNGAVTALRILALLAFLCWLVSVLFGHERLTMELRIQPGPVSILAGTDNRPGQEGHSQAPTGAPFARAEPSASPPSNVDSQEAIVASHPLQRELAMSHEEAAKRVADCIRVMKADAKMSGVKESDKQRGSSLSKDISSRDLQLIWADYYVAYKDSSHIVTLVLSDSNLVKLKGDKLYSVLDGIVHHGGNEQSLQELAHTTCPVAFSSNK